jgi:hypothetical protein
MATQTILNSPENIITFGYEQITGKTETLTLAFNGDLKPIVVSEAQEVVKRAIEAYIASTAAMRGTRSAIKKLYLPHGPGKVRYTGPTAEDILEDYLAGLGYRRGSQMWFDLSRIVIEHAEGNITDEPEVACWCRINKVPFIL